MLGKGQDDARARNLYMNRYSACMESTKMMIEKENDL
jgi:hypothetical protein